MSDENDDRNNIADALKDASRGRSAQDERGAHAVCDDAVQVLFIEDGVYALLQTEPGRVSMPEYSRHIKALGQLGHRIFAERESLAERGIECMNHEAQVITRAEVAALLLGSDGIIRY